MVTWVYFCGRSLLPLLQFLQAAQIRRTAARFKLDDILRKEQDSLRDLGDRIKEEVQTELNDCAENWIIYLSIY